MTSCYHGSTIFGGQQNQRRRRRQGERQKKKKKKEKKLPCYTAVARLGFKRRATAVPNSIHKL